jgi:hypothetical protein
MSNARNNADNLAAIEIVNAGAYPPGSRDALLWDATDGKGRFTSASAIASVAFSAAPTIPTAGVAVLYFGELTANVTDFNLSDTGPKVVVVFKQNGTGGYTVTAGSSIDFGTEIPDLSGIAAGAGAYTYVGFVYHPTTTKFRVVAISK